jgi:hypothetical protein
MADFRTAQQSVQQDENVVDIPIFQKNGDPYLAADGTTQCTVGVVGAESRAARHAERTARQRYVRMLQTGGVVATTDDEEQESVEIEKTAACVVRWFGWTDGDSEYPCTPDNVRQLLAVPHIHTQVAAGVAKHAGFFARSARR